MMRFFTILLLCVTAGCISSNLATSDDTITEYRQDIVLSIKHPENSVIEAKLIEIASDGTTTIEVMPAGPKLQARVGAYFVSAEYGKHGLELVSASPEKQEAHLVRRTAK
jgi:hypothetical protein